MVFSGILNPNPLIGLLKYIQLGPALSAFWADIDGYIRDMEECGRKVILQSKWNAETIKLVVKVIDKFDGLIKKQEEVVVEEDEIGKMVPEFYTEEEAKKLISGVRINKTSKTITGK